MESWRSVKMFTPTNRSDHLGIPRTKVERTTSLRLIHTYGVEDPAGLCRPELGASGVERGGRSRNLSLWWRIDLMRGSEREGAALRQRTISVVCETGASTSTIYRGR